MKNQEPDYKKLFQNMQLGVVYLDSEGKIIDSNPAAEKILGLSNKEMGAIISPQETWKAIKIDGSPYPNEEHPSTQALKTGKTIRDKVMGITNPKTKKQIWINIDAVPEYDNNKSNSPLRVFTTFTDVTQKQELQNQLFETEKKFQALFENGPIGIAYHKMVYDKNNKPIDYFFLDANKNYQKLTGVDPRGKLVTEAFPGIEKDPADWIGTFARAGQKGETVRFQQYLQPVDRWYDAVGYQSSPDHFVAAFFEITEQKRKELELERLKNELEDKVKERTKQLKIEKENAEAANKAKSIFLANMSHELRTPLNAVLGYTDILHGQLKNSEHHQYLNSISTSGKALLSLINDVLDLSKIETGKFELEHSATNIKNIVEDIEVIFSQKIKDKGLLWKVSISDEIPQCLILDEKRIRQILLNLVSNAVKFTENGKIKLVCKPYKNVPSGKGEIHLQITVSDTGKGIEKEDLDRIFNAFEQAKNQKPSEYGGTGLGLSISQYLVKMMHGEINVTSKPGKGSDFNIIIRNIEIAQAPDKLSQKQLIDPDSITFHPANVLIVDDIDYNRDMLGTFLQPYDLTLNYAKNGKEALKSIKHKKPDLLLLDMKMPVMDGYELSQLLKESDEYQDIPIIAVTASSISVEEEMIKLNCEAFLRKPLSRAEIVTEMSVFLPYRIQEIALINQPGEQNVRISSLDNNVINQMQTFILNGDMDGIESFIKTLESKSPEQKATYDYIKNLAMDCKEQELQHLFDSE